MPKKDKQKLPPTRLDVDDPQSKYVPTSWGGAVGGYEELVVPSGQTCLARRPGVEGLLKAGILHNLDILSVLVDKQMNEKDGSTSMTTIEQDVSVVLEDPAKLEELLHVVDKVVCHVVVMPQVVLTPNDVTRRKPGIVYADMIELEDKMYLFQYAVGGTRDIEQFRNELQQSMGSLDAS